MKIVYLERDSIGYDIDVARLGEFGDLTIWTELDQKKTVERIQDAEILLVNKTILDQETLKNANNLKLICEMATGYDNIDIKYCEEQGIAVANAGHYSTTAVVQHTFALTFALLGNLAYYDNYVRSGQYRLQKKFSHFDKPVFEIAGKTWGIVGMGDIGKSVARMASAFGCSVIFFSPTGKSTCKEFKRVSFNELLTQSDIISLHCPLSNLTENLFGSDAFEKMKQSAFLINVARGKVVDQHALYEAITNNEIAGAGLDVLAVEPIRSDNPLSAINNPEKLIITPHMAWASVDARQRDFDIACDNIRAFLNGEKKNRIV